MSKIYVSENGLNKLRNDLTEANQNLTSLRSEKTLAYTAAGDNWHDNPYFNKLEQDEQRLVKKITALQSEISGAEIYNPEPRNTERVRLGSIVRLISRNKKNGKETTETWEIVGFGETDVSKNHLAYNAPLGVILLGLQQGDIKERTMPHGSMEYEIVELYPNWEAVPKTT